MHQYPEFAKRSRLEDVAAVSDLVVSALPSGSNAGAKFCTACSASQASRCVPSCTAATQSKLPPPPPLFPFPGQLHMPRLEEALEEVARTRVGGIPRAEFVRMLQSRMPPGSPLGQPEVELLVKVFDPDGDGMLEVADHWCVRRGKCPAASSVY